MSTLISSAVSGKKTAPKGAPRRRPAPPPGAAKQATPISISSAQTSVAPLSPPPTLPIQTTPIEEEHTYHAEIPPTPASPVQARPQSLQTGPSRGPTAIRTPTPIALPIPTQIQQSIPEDEDLPPPSSPQVSKKRRADQTPAKATTQPAKRVKRNSARSNATVQAQVDNEETPLVLDPALRSTEPTVSASPAPAPAASAQKPKKPRKGGRKAKSKTADEGPQHDLELLDRQLEAARPKRRRRKKKATAEPGTDTDTRPAADGEEARSDDSDDDSDPELHEIDPNTVTMFDVSYNKKYGKTSEREKKMAEIDWKEVAAKRRAENEATAAQQQPTTEEVRQTTEGAAGTAEPLPPPPEGTATVGGVRFRIVNGQIVEDETSLTIDRNAQAFDEAVDNEAVEEESDLTQRINQMTWLHDRRRDVADRVPASKRKSDPWTDEETDKFYDCLATIGTDFFMISTLFKPKTRRMIKAKFTREERLDGKRINDALLGLKGTRPTLNLETYAREVGRDVSEYLKFESAEHAEEVIRESMREKEQEMREAIQDEEEQEEAAREAEVVRERRKKKAAEKKEGKGAGKGGKGGGGRKGGRKKGVPAMGGGGVGGD